jgi:HK97 family phage major capsid protein
MSTVTQIEEVRKAMAEADKAIDAGAVQAKAEELVKKALEKQDALVKSEGQKKGAQFRAENDRAYADGVPELAGEDPLLRKSNDPRILDFQTWNDRMLIVQNVMGGVAKKNGYRYDVRKSREYRSGVDRFGDLLRKASSGMNNATAGQGYEWYPTMFSSRLFDAIRLERAVPALFEQITMPAPVYTAPVNLGNLSVIKLSETTEDDATAMAASSPTTGVFTLTAKKMGRRVPVSDEATEDSIVALVPFLESQFRNAVATGIEDAIINGDVTATHQDASVAATSVQRLWRGLRKQAIANSLTLSAANNPPSDSYLMQAQQKMGKYGARPSEQALILSPRGYIAGRQAITAIRTKDVSDQATIDKGVWTKWGGVDVIVSELMRDDLNESGLYDLTNQSWGAAIFVNRRGWVLGERRKVTLRSWEKIETEQLMLTVSWRGDFAPVYGTSSAVCAYLYYMKIGKS